ncbi:MAG: L-threonine 3-dehydrogenase [Alphaproteobacteria bacterium]|nr:L-threonine 3-dehydrogenase [Alphaproteobacteria bacterium]
MFGITKERAERGVWDREVEDPQTPGFGEVSITVRQAGICGTDYHIYKWDAWSAGRVKPPLTMGHEFVGEIAAVGPGVSHLRAGQRVSCESHITCGHCVQCRTGRAHLCANTQIIGVDRAGCFAEAITVPAGNVWVVDPRIPDHHAAVFDPVGNAMHTVTRIGVSGRDVLVVGAGAIGLFAVAICRAHGARSIVVHEPNTYRAGLVKGLGADLVLDPSDGRALAAWERGLNGEGPDAILEMSGYAPAIRGALKVARNGADVALLGLPAGPVSLDLAEDVVMRGLTLCGVTGRRMFDTWFAVEAFMLRAPELMDRVVTHIMPARSYAQGFALLDQGACGKVVLDFAGLRGRAA